MTFIYTIQDVCALLFLSGIALYVFVSCVKDWLKRK